jgi:hypothetical protein
MPDVAAAPVLRRALLRLHGGNARPHRQVDPFRAHDETDPRRRLPFCGNDDCAMAHRSQNGDVFILWSAYFDEVMVTLFAAALRRAGWRTKLIGLQGLAHPGKHGLTVVADLSLGQALHSEWSIACVVAPCTPEVLLAQVDPRVGDLLAKARQQGAVLVAANSAGPLLDSRWPVDAHKVETEPARMLDAAHALLAELDHAK